MGRKLIAAPAETLPFSVVLSEHWGWRGSEGEYYDLPDGLVSDLGERETLFEAALLAEDSVERLRHVCPGMLVSVVHSLSGERVLESLWTG